MASCQKSLHQHISEIKTNEALFILVTDQALFHSVSLFAFVPIAREENGSTSASTRGIKTSGDHYLLLPCVLLPAVQRVSLTWSVREACSPLWLLTYMSSEIGTAAQLNITTHQQPPVVLISTEPKLSCRDTLPFLTWVYNE